MNRSKFIHRVDVTRQVITPAEDGTETRTTQTVFSDLRCLMVPLSAYATSNIFGKVAHARLQMTWGEEAVRDGDWVTFHEKRYRLSDITGDTLRPSNRYQTAVLAEVAGQ